MQGCLLQDWVTIRLGGVTTVAQGADSWLDIGDDEDLAFFLDVREINNGTNVVYETSPTKQEQSFVALVHAFTPTVGTRVDRAFSTFGAVPPARYVRWRLSSPDGSACDLTFRIWVASYAWVKA